MKLLDVNILVGVHREETAQHEELKTWLEKAIEEPAGVAISELA
jgi:predicted nucleic acid-binding protein